MRRGIRIPAELSYGNRLRYDMVTQVMYNKEVRCSDTTRVYSFIIVPDFGLYAFSAN